MRSSFRISSLEVSWCCLFILSICDPSTAFETFTRDEVAAHNSSDSLWMVMDNHVYDVTEFLEMHPGGKEVLLIYAGADGTIPFIIDNHPGTAYELRNQYLIGCVVEADMKEYDKEGLHSKK